MGSEQPAKGNKGHIIKRRTKQGNDCSSNGYVLIFVLWAITIISMVALGFSKDTKVAVMLKSISADRLKNSYTARGASLYGLKRLSSDDNQSTVKSVSKQPSTGVSGLAEPGVPPTEGAAPTFGNNGNEKDKSEEIEKNKEIEENKEKIKWVPGRNPYSVQIGDIDCDVYLYPENGKININGINDGNRKIFVNFLTKKGIEESDADVVTDSILDWIDEDDLNHLNGAEDGYYESLPDPYKSKDSTFFSIEELTLVRGITPEIFESIKDDITVYGEEKITINVNIASKEVLSSIPGLTDDMVDELYLYLEENGSIKTSEELREDVFWSLGLIGSFYKDVEPYLTVDPSDFVTISAISRGLKKGASAHSGKPDLSNVKNRYSGPARQGRYGGYDYKLVVGRTEKGYKIHAVYPE